MKINYRKKLILMKMPTNFSWIKDILIELIVLLAIWLVWYLLVGREITHGLAIFSIIIVGILIIDLIRGILITIKSMT